MFIRRRQIDGTDHIKIVICESVRTGHKVVQKTIRTVGTTRNESELNVYLKAAEQAPQVHFF